MVFIDKAQACDLKAILELQYLAYQSEAKLFGNMDIPPLMQTIEEVCEEFQKGTVLKAVDDSGDIIGSVRAYEENGTVYIGKLMVHPKMQKQGIGTQLLLAMENEFPNCRYELFTSTKSISNIRLYERLGYKIFKEEAVSEELQFVYLEKCIMDIGTKNELLNRIAYNDNEIGKIYRDNYEYVIEINMWNGDIRILKTVNCRKIVHNVELIDEIGDIIFNDKVYKFLTVDDSDDGPETILEIVADDIILIK